MLKTVKEHFEGIPIQNINKRMYQGFLNEYGKTRQKHLTDSAILQFMSDVFVMPIFYIIITVAFTFLFKNSAGGITFTLGIMVLPSLVKMFPDSIQRLFLPIFLQSAIHSISGVLEQGSPESLGIILASLYYLFGLQQFYL